MSGSFPNIRLLVTVLMSSSRIALQPLDEETKVITMNHSDSLEQPIARPPIFG